VDLREAAVVVVEVVSVVAVADTTIVDRAMASLVPLIAMLEEVHRASGDVVVSLPTTVAHLIALILARATTALTPRVDMEATTEDPAMTVLASLPDRILTRGTIRALAMSDMVVDAVAEVAMEIPVIVAAEMVTVILVIVVATVASKDRATETKVVTTTVPAEDMVDVETIVDIIHTTTREATLLAVVVMEVTVATT